MKYKDGKYPNEPQKDEDAIEEIFMDGWRIKKTDENRYYLFYISGALQGMEKNIEITEIDYSLAKEKKLDLNDLCIKYGVF